MGENIFFLKIKKNWVTHIPDFPNEGEFSSDKEYISLSYSVGQGLLPV